jgi:hypothetical protein
MIALAQLGEVVSTERKAQILAELFKVFSSLQAIEQLFLDQRPIDLAHGIAFHGDPLSRDSLMIHPGARSVKVLDW